MIKSIAIAAVTLLFCGAALHAQHPTTVTMPPASQTKRTSTRATNCWRGNGQFQDRL